MINENDIDSLSDNLTESNVREFFRRNADQLVYFYYVSDIELPAVDTLKTFEKGELIVPTRQNENGTFAVTYTNKKLAHSLVESDFKVASTKLHKFVEVARSMKPVNGIFVQGNSCWFTIGLKELES